MKILGRTTLSACCAVLLVLSGCDSSSRKPSATSATAAAGPAVAVTAAPATPTGGGTALTESYRQRCSASLLHESPPHAHTGGSVHELRLRSPDSSGKERSVFVYRPGGIPDTAALPVVYLLHGLPGDAASLWTKSGAAKLLDAEFTRGGAPYEVVTLDGNGARHKDTEWADSVDGTDKVETFVLDVAIPAVEGTHRRDACHRAIAGFSMGGYGAINLAQRHPDVFGQVAAIAAYFHVDDPDTVFGNDKAILAANSPDRQVNRLRGLRVFLLDAGQENLDLVKGETERFARLLIAAKIPVELDYSPGTHTGEYALAQQPAVSTFLETGWRPQPG